MNDGVESTPPQSPEVRSGGRPDAGVSRELANARVAVIGSVTYDVDLDLADGGDTYNGTTIIGFDLAAPVDQLVIDFRGRTVANLRVGERSSTEWKRVENHIVVPGEAFQPGRNSVRIAFTGGIGSAGEGLIRTIDSEDGSPYVYSLNVPADGHAVLPCFDQPDLKGRFALSVRVPAEWTVIANGPRTEIIEEVDAKTFRFGRTRPISTYLFAFAAGPFIELADDSGPHPMHLYGRRTQRRLLEEQAAEMFAWHATSLRYLEGYFGIPYPFQKFDFVLVPDFPFGGMEHPGCIFYGEDRLVFRTQTTRVDEAARASIIAHETAHMWFGDLVTMPWFDDVWLKEGFANLMAHKVLESAFEGVDHLRDFFLKYHPSALQSDVTRGAQPVRKPLGNLADAKSNYGPIIYMKGPAVLRQLEQMMSEPAFQKGVRRFLRDHAYANADWDALRRALEFGWGRGDDSLVRWGRSWIESPGAPTIRIRRESREEGHRLHVRQIAPDGSPGRWPMQLAIGHLKGTTLEVNAVSMDAESAALDIEDRSPFVHPNAGVAAYGHFLLDEDSLGFALRDITAIDDPVARAQVWEAIWGHVQVSEIRPRAHLFLVMRHLLAEGDARLVRLHLGRAATTLARYVKGEDAASFRGQFVAWLLRNVDDTELAKDLRVLCFRTALATADAGPGAARLVQWIEGGAAPQELTIATRDRWRMVRRLVRLDHPRAEELLAKMKKDDSSDDGRRQAFLVECARPDRQSKLELFERFRKDESLHERWIQNGVGPFFGSPELTADLLAPALEDLAWIKKNRKIFFLADWINAAIRTQVAAQSVEVVESYLRREDVPPDIRLKVMVALDHLKRTVAIRQN